MAAAVSGCDHSKRRGKNERENNGVYHRLWLIKRGQGEDQIIHFQQQHDYGVP